MPGISDPGSRLVAAAADSRFAGHRGPRPSAVLAALVTSGFATGRFCFEGFLPRSGRDRKDRLEAVASEPRTTVLFEAPGRVAATMADLVGACGPERRIAVARELTKLHEEIWRGSLAEAVPWIGDHPVRGEVVLVLSGAPEPTVDAVSDQVLTTALAERLAGGSAYGGWSTTSPSCSACPAGGCTSWRWPPGRRRARFHRAIPDLPTDDRGGRPLISGAR